VGVPEIVIVFEANAAETPEGRPVAVPIPLAPVVPWVIAVNAVFIQRVGVEDAVPTVFKFEATLPLKVKSSIPNVLVVLLMLYKYSRNVVAVVLF